MAFDKRTHHLAEIDEDQLWCPRCGTKLRWALVPAEAVVESDGDTLPMEAIEKHAILTAVRKAGNDKTLAARMLGIGRTTLYRKLREYAFDAPSTLVSADTASSRQAAIIIPKAPADTIGEIELTNHPEPLEATEKAAILRAMQETENDRQLVAQMLGIGRTTLYRRLKEYGMPRSRRPHSKVARKS